MSGRPRNHARNRLIVKAYVDCELSANQIGRLFTLNPRTVAYTLKKHGFQLRETRAAIAMGRQAVAPALRSARALHAAKARWAGHTAVSRWVQVRERRLASCAAVPATREEK